MSSNEFERLKRILANNGFPSRFIETYIGKQLTKLYVSEQTITSENIKKPVIYVPLTFTGQQSNRLKKQLSNLFSRTYPQLDVRIYYQIQNRLKDFFRLKDKLPTCLRSMVIYRWKCRDCDATYIGRCQRLTWTRWHDHLGKSFRTGNYLVKPSYSAIREHREETGHSLSLEDFSVLAGCSSRRELEILESMYTSREKPSLARSVPSTSLLCF